MRTESDNSYMVQEINKWFNLVSTFQIIFIVISFLLFFPVAILGIILFIVMNRKTKLAVKVAIAGHVFITVGSVACVIVYKLTETAADAAFVSSYEVIFRLIYAAGIITLIINLFITALCIRAYSYARENDFLKELDGYPYFFEKEHNSQKSSEKNILQTKTVYLEIKSFGNNDFWRYCVNAIKQTMYCLFDGKINDVIGYSKLMTVFIIFINFAVSMIFSNKVAGLNAFIELGFLLIVLVKPVRKRVAIGFQIHTIWLMILICNTDMGRFSIVLLIMNIIQIFMDLSVYKKCSSIEASQRQTFKENFIKNNPENDIEYVDCNGVYKKKLHVELKKKSDLCKDNDKKA